MPVVDSPADRLVVEAGNPTAAFLPLAIDVADDSADSDFVFRHVRM